MGDPGGPQAYRHQIRLRYRSVRRLHGAHRRQARVLVPDPNVGGCRQVGARDRTRGAGGVTMTQHLTIASSSPRSARRQLLSRRQVMIGAAGLSFAIAVGVNRRAAAAVLGSERSGKALSPWVSIAPDE